MSTSLAEAPTVNIENVLVGEAYQQWVTEQLQQASSDGAVHTGDPSKFGITINSNGETVACAMTDHNSMYTRQYSVGEQGYLNLQSYEVGYKVAPGANNGMFVSLGEPTVEVVGREGLNLLQQEFSALSNTNKQ